MDMKEVRKNAREAMKGYCRVCPRCDGRACAGEVPGMGGLGTGSSFHANMEALDAVKFHMRCLHDATAPDTSTTLFGQKLSLPVLAAPIGGVGFNMGAKLPEPEYIKAKVAACAAKGALGCTGDGVPEEIHMGGFDAIRNVDGMGIPFIKPWVDKELFEKMDKAAEVKPVALGMDVDAAGLITLAKMGRPVSPKPLAKLKEIIARWDGPFIVKGIMTVDDARRAADAGAAAIVVSNHGGRVLDHALGTAEVLPAIAAAVGRQITVLADGGVRTGADVLKMLALGAHGVCIGRPFSIAVVGGGQEGAELYLDELKAQLTQAMVLTGCDSIPAVGDWILA